MIYATFIYDTILVYALLRARMLYRAMYSRGIDFTPNTQETFIMCKEAKLAVLESIQITALVLPSIQSDHHRGRGTVYCGARVDASVLEHSQKN